MLLALMLTAGCSTTAPPTKAPAVLTQQQAHRLAEELAVAHYGWIIGAAGIERSNPPSLHAGEWLWRWRQGRGKGDREITVSFAPDGSSPVVDYQFVSGEVYIRP
jgi:hypothetical protein